MSSLPRGVTLIQWKNTTKGKEKQNKFRVRIQRKVDGFPVKIDKLFDTLQEAKNFLNDFNSNLGRQTLNKINREEDERVKQIKAFIEAPPLSYYIDNYIRDYVETRPQTNQLQKRNVASIKAFFNTIKRTKIPYRHNDTTKPLAQAGGILAQMFNETMRNSSDGLEFGNFKVLEISYIEINDYIKQRLKTVKKISVSRELTFIKKLFDNLKYQDKAFFNLQNPVPLHDKSLLINRDTASKNNYRLSVEDRDILFKALDNHPNWEMKAICLLSYYLGLRRSEVVLLTWEQIHIQENYIQLHHTKSGSPRKVYLLKEATEILETIPRTNGERLFSYKLLGFSGSFDKMIETLGLRQKGFHFHFFRREAISNLVFNIGQKTQLEGTEFSILISELLGIENVRTLEKNHLSQLPPTSIDTQNQIMKSIGHNNKQTTKRYSRIKVPKRS